MYICVCHAVTDRQILTAIDNGARTMRDLRRDLGICSSCGKCGPCARGLLAESTTARPAEATAPVAGFPTLQPA